MTSRMTNPLFVGSYSSKTEPGIHAYQFDVNSGDLSHLNSFTGIENPSFLAIHPNGRFLYAVSETSLGGDGAQLFGDALQAEVHLQELGLDIFQVGPFGGA